MARIDPNVQVGQEIVIDGVTYVVGYRESHGPHTQRQTEYVALLGLRRPRGKKLFAMSMTADGRTGRLVNMGW